MGQLGIGVMFGILGGAQSGNREAIDKAIGRVISEITGTDETITIRFTDGSNLEIVDDGQCCCESRYITSDDLPCSVSDGETFVSVEESDMPSEEDDCGVHEQVSVKIQTSLQSLTFVTHNEHNGYYGGFLLVARFDEVGAK